MQDENLINNSPNSLVAVGVLAVSLGSIGSVSPVPGGETSSWVAVPLYQIRLE